MILKQVKKCLLLGVIFSLFTVPVLAEGLDLTEENFIGLEKISLDLESDSLQTKSYEVSDTSYVPAEVLSVFEEQHSIEGGDNLSFILIQKINLEIKKGDRRGEIVEINNELSSNPLNMKVKAGDRVVLQIDLMQDGQDQYFLMDYYRVPMIWVLLIIFVLVLIILGGWKGLKTVFALGITIVLLFYVFIPMTLAGKNPLFLAIVISVLATIFTLLLIGGHNKKSYAAIFGTLSGIFIALLVTYFFSVWAHLNGLSGEDSRALFSAHSGINPLNLFFAAILIGAMGAVMDSAMSVASAVSELKKNMPNAPFSVLFKTGMAVGRDVMGTMANTLILAYVSVSVPMLLLYYDFGSGLNSFLNFDFVSEEIVRSIGGSLGLISSIPLTALIAAKLESFDFKNKINHKL